MKRLILIHNHEVLSSSLSPATKIEGSYNDKS